MKTELLKKTLNTKTGKRKGKSMIECMEHRKQLWWVSSKMGDLNASP